LAKSFSDLTHGIVLASLLSKYMPTFSAKSMMGFLKRKGGDANPGASRGLSVNSLSKVSGQLTSLARGNRIRAASFWLCFFVCASLVADLSALLFEKNLPLPPVSPLASRSALGVRQANPSQYEVISDRNLFSSKAPKKGGGGSIDLDAEPVPTTLNYQLIGTVIFRNPARSIAAVQDKSDNKLYPVRVGDQMGDNVQILSVEPRRVIFINTTARRKEFIEIPEDTTIKISTGSTGGKAAPAGGINQVEENKFVISRSEIDSQMANFANGGLQTDSNRSQQLLPEGGIQRKRRHQIGERRTDHRRRKSPGAFTRTEINALARYGDRARRKGRSLQL